jgi:hypothetical protein
MGRPAHFQRGFVDILWFEKTLLLYETILQRRSTGTIIPQQTVGEKGRPRSSYFLSADSLAISTEIPARRAVLSGPPT